VDDVLTGNSSVLFLFIFLLPGFLGLLVYGALREGKAMQNFDRVIIAFVLALVSSLCVFMGSLLLHLVFGTPVIPMIPAFKLSNTTSAPDVLGLMVNVGLFASSVVAVLLSFAVAILNNANVIQNKLIRMKLSNKRSNNDVWSDVFYKLRGYWVRLEFKDGRSLTGWTESYSASGEPRELFIANATWSHVDETGKVIAVDIEGPGVYVPDLGEISNIAILS
jgi:hypothetical protein